MAGPQDAFIGAFHTNSYSLLNGHGYSRMAEDYRMLSKKDALCLVRMRWAYPWPAH